LPPEVERIAGYYIGDDDSRGHEAGLEGGVYLEIDDNDSNLADIEPVVVEISDRLEDRALEHNDYISFYARAGLPAPFASYIIVPISHRCGVLRIESLTNGTFGRSQYMPLKQMARKLDLAFTIAWALNGRRGDEQDE